MTLRARLIPWFCGTLAIILLIFCGMLLLLQPQVDIDVLDDELRDDVVTVAGVLATETREVGEGRAAVAGMLEELQLPGRGLVIFNGEGVLLGERWTGLAPDPAVIDFAVHAPRTETLTTPAGESRAHVENVTLEQRPYRILVAASLEQVAHEGAMLRRAVFVA